LVVVVVVVVVVVATSDPGNDQCGWPVVLPMDLPDHQWIDESIGFGLFSQPLSFRGENKTHLSIVAKSSMTSVVFVNGIQIVPLKVVVSVIAAADMEATISDSANLVVVEPHDTARKRSHTGRTGSIEATSQMDGREGCCGCCRRGAY